VPFLQIIELEISLLPGFKKGIFKFDRISRASSHSFFVLSIPEYPSIISPILITRSAWRRLILSMDCSNIFPLSRAVLSDIITKEKSSGESAITGVRVLENPLTRLVESGPETTSDCAGRT
jgi:hypothetical protein